MTNVPILCSDCIDYIPLMNTAFVLATDSLLQRVVYLILDLDCLVLTIAAQHENGHDPD